MAALRKPEDDDQQYKEIGLEGVGAEVGWEFGRIVLLLVSYMDTYMEIVSKFYPGYVLLVVFHPKITQLHCR